MLAQVSSDSRPFIHVKIFGKDVVALLDSGANRSIIGRHGRKMLRSFKLKMAPSECGKITTADGKEQSVIGSCDIPVAADTVYKIMNFLVVPSVQHSIILGSDFCVEFGITIDYKNGRWEAQDTGYSKMPVNYMKLWTLENNTFNFDSHEKKIIEDIISSYKEIGGTKTHLGQTNKLIHHINTGEAKPFKQRQYPFSPYLMKHLNAELDKMLELGVIEKSHGAWSSPVLLVKKSSGEYRFCFDGRMLNSVTKPDRYPLPRVDRILNMLSEARFISSIDLRSAFWQIPLDEASKERTGFAIPGRGMFRFRVMPFGLCNAAQTQQRLMDAVFGPELEPHVFSYLDDIIVVSKTFSEHVHLLKSVLTRLKDANLTVNLEKCEFFKRSLKYLGYVIDGNGLRTDPGKVSAMLNFPRPTTTTEVKRFIGMCSWYRRFIHNFSTLVAPINDLLKGRRKKQSIQWTPEAESAFVKIKQALISAPILRSPDFTKPFTIQCDASNTGVGGVLTQSIDDEEVVIAFCSRSLSRAERNYTVTEKELLALIFSMEKFRPYVEGSHFKVITDHYSLLWLKRLKEPTGRLARWALKLQQFSFDLEHRKGKFNIVPDALSRATTPETNLITVTRQDMDPWYSRMIRHVNENPEKYPRWQVENDVLFKYIASRRSVNTNCKEWKLVVPVDKRQDVIKQCHDPPTSGHFGFYKTLARLQEEYYWPKMSKDVMKYVRQCYVCGSQKCSSEGRIGLMGKQKCAKCPFQILAVDIMGPFPRSSQGNSYLLVAVDWFTKYTLLCPLRKANAVKVVDFLEKQVFLVYGVPQFIICDNGTEFNNTTFKKLAQKYQVSKIWYNARYHPQCNFVERVNKTVGTAIRSYLQENQRVWDHNISQIQSAINTAQHEVTGFAPAFLNFGRVIPTNGQFYGHMGEDIKLLPGKREDYFEELKKMPEIYKVIQSKLDAAYRKNADTYNLRKRNVEFEEGERVWRRNKVLSSAATGFSAKLAPKYVPGKIINKKSRLVYTVENIDGTTGDWHIKDLKPYFGSDSDINAQ